MSQSSEDLLRTAWWSLKRGRDELAKVARRDATADHDAAMAEMEQTMGTIHARLRDEVAA